MSRLYAPQGQPAHSPGQSEAAPWVMNAVGSEAVSKVTDTASFLGYYSNVALMEGFYAAIL